jgi:hypothetical protein
MDNFNLHKYFENSYIKEAMGDDKTIEAKIKNLEKKYEKELETKFPDYKINFFMGFHGTNRPEGDKYEGKGYGTIEFLIKDELRKNDWNKVLELIKNWGFEVTQESNYYEKEFDGDRTWHPSIKFEFIANNILNE